jgi:hypothetical protein
MPMITSREPELEVFRWKWGRSRKRFQMAAAPNQTVYRNPGNWYEQQEKVRYHQPRRNPHGNPNYQRPVSLFKVHKPSTHKITHTTSGLKSFLKIQSNPNNIWVGQKDEWYQYQC